MWSVETVMPRSMCSHFAIHPSVQSRAGVEYEVASGMCIPNLGERRCEVYTDGGASALLMHFQVADVHKPLLSVSRCADMGYECRLGKSGGVLIEIETGEIIPLVRSGNLYSMHVWVKNRNTEPTTAGFSGQR